MSGTAGTGGIEYQQWPPQCGGLLPCTYWPQDAVAFTHLTRHAAVMGPTWGVLIPATILMARLRHEKGWWFKLHQALAVLSLVLVMVGAWLGRRLSHSHQTHSRAAGIHSVLGYTTTAFIVAQALSALLWRPLAGHSYRPVWAVIHRTWGQLVLVLGTVAVVFGIHIAGVGWPYYPWHILLMTIFLFAPAVFISSPSKQVPSQKTNGHTSNSHKSNGHISNGLAKNSNGVTEKATGLIPWLLKQQRNHKEA